MSPWPPGPRSSFLLKSMFPPTSSNLMWIVVPAQAPVVVRSNDEITAIELNSFFMLPYSRCYAPVKLIHLSMVFIRLKSKKIWILVYRPAPRSFGDSSAQVVREVFKTWVYPLWGHTSKYCVPRPDVLTRRGNFVTSRKCDLQLPQASHKLRHSGMRARHRWCLRHSAHHSMCRAVFRTGARKR